MNYISQTRRRLQPCKGWAISLREPGLSSFGSSPLRGLAAHALQSPIAGAVS